MSKFLEKQLEKNLALTLIDFKNEKDLLEFLKDFLTKKEFNSLLKRINILYWLSKKRNIENITNNLNVTPKTIKLVTPLLDKENIRKAIRKIDADIWSEKWSQKIKGLVKSP